MKDVKLNELSPAWRELYDAAVLPVRMLTFLIPTLL